MSFSLFNGLSQCSTLKVPVVDHELGMLDPATHLGEAISAWNSF